MNSIFSLAMQNPTVFQYQSAKQYVTDVIEEMKRSDPEFSLRRFAKTSGFGSHAYLIMILKGKRSLTLKQVPALAMGFGLDSSERVFLQTLIQLDNSKTEEERNLCRTWLNDLNPRREFRILEVEHYHVIADWIHMAILTLAKIPGTVITAENVYALVGKKVPLAEVRTAIERLLDLRLLEEKDGTLVPTHHSVKSRDDVPNKGAREYHKQVMKLAASAIEEQKPEIREFQSFAFTMRADRLDLAKDLIRKFRHQLVQLMEAEPGEEVYQCNLQFFRLTERPSRKETRATVNEGAGIPILNP